jgi:hypothetical protein
MDTHNIIKTFEFLGLNSNFKLKRLNINLKLFLIHKMEHIYRIYMNSVYVS